MFNILTLNIFCMAIFTGLFIIGFFAISLFEVIEEYLHFRKEKKEAARLAAHFVTKKSGIKTYYSI